MVVACWSLKGGSGTTAVAAALGVMAARRRERGALVVDLGGDVPAVLGMPEPVGAGLTEWLVTAGAHDPPGRVWTAGVLYAGPRLFVVPRGQAPLRNLRAAEMLTHLLDAEQRHVVVDCGVLGAVGPTDELAGPGHILAREATVSLLVTRACALSLRRLATSPLRTSGVVVLREAGRALPSRDIERAVGAPVVAEVPYDPDVAHALDAGHLTRRLPPTLHDALQPCDP